MTVEDFSAGYWRATTLEVQSHSEYPVIEKGLYDIIDNRLYQGAGARPTFKIGLDRGSVFSPRPEAAVPTDVIGVPPELMGPEVDSDVSEREVFILKPDNAHFLME